METIITSEEVRELKELTTQIEQDFQNIGIYIDAMPEQLHRQLDECINVQLIAGLSEINELTLGAFYLDKKAKQLEHKLATLKVEQEVNELQTQLEKETKQCDLLEKFVNKYGNATKEENTKEAIQFLKKKLHTLQQQQERLKVPDELKIDELIMKIKMIEQKKAEIKK